MKKILLRLFALAAFPVGAQEFPNTLSLEEAVEWGMQYNRTLQKASLELQKAHKEKWKTISIGFPQINASFQYQNFIEQPVSLIPAQFFGGNQGEFAEVTFGTSQTAMGAVELNQLLFDGTYVVGVQGIRHYIETAENVLEKTEIEIKKALITSYVNVLTAQETLSVLENNAKILNKNIEEAHQLFKNGFAEEETVEQLRLTLSNLNAQIRYATSSLELSENVLKLLLGQEVSIPLNLSNSLAELTALSVFKSDIPKDYSNNIDLRLSENNVTSEKLLYRLERAKNLPSFSAFINGNYMGNSNTFTFLDAEQKWFGSSAFGLRVRVPIFSSFGRKAGSQKAKLSLDQAELSLIETKAEVFVAYQKATHDFRLAQENFSTAQESLNLAERIEQKNTTKFFEGLSSSFELRQAQVQLYQAQQNFIQSMRQIILDKTQLDTIINNPQ